MENIIGVIPLTTVVPVQCAFDDDERMSLVCIKLEKLVDKNPSF